MKTIQILSIILLVVFGYSCNDSESTDQNEVTTSNQTRDIYQLKVYSFDTDEQISATDSYLKNAFLPGLKRLGIENIGVFKPRLGDEFTMKKTFVLIPFSSFQQFYTLDNELAKNNDYLEAGKEYLEAPHNNTPYKRIESTLLKAFKDMPIMQVPKFNSDRQDRVYELRSYESATEDYHIKKVDMFNAGGEIELFEKLDFNAVFYGQVISGAKMPNLMYMTTFSDEDSQKAHWDAFVNSPEWSTMKVLTKYANTVSHIDKYLLYPTDYSDY